MLSDFNSLSAVFDASILDRVIEGLDKAGEAWDSSDGFVEFFDALQKIIFKKPTDHLLSRLYNASLETIYIVLVSSVVAALGGIPIGIVLVATRSDHVLGKMWRINSFVSIIVNMTRSIPFIIFMLFMGPVTRWIVGSQTGTTAAIVPLSIAAVAFTARLAETALLEVPYGLIEAAQSCGASVRQIIWRVLLPEARSGLVSVMTITVITLIGYSAMAGTVGGGGLGNLAINYGHVRYYLDTMLATVLILLIMVQIIQSGGDWLAKKLNRK